MSTYIRTGGSELTQLVLAEYMKIIICDVKHTARKLDNNLVSILNERDQWDKIKTGRCDE